jgi:hypothetical protein
MFVPSLAKMFKNINGSKMPGMTRKNNDRENKSSSKASLEPAPAT